MKVLFLSDQPIIQPVGDEDNAWLLLNDLEVAVVGDDGNKINFEVQSGMVYDLASIPRLARVSVPQTSRTARAATVHDWIYDRMGETFTRAQADAIFKAILKLDGVSWWTRNKMYLAVRAGGWVPWNKRWESA